MAPDLRNVRTHECRGRPFPPQFGSISYSLRAELGSHGAQVTPRSEGPPKVKKEAAREPRREVGNLNDAEDHGESARGRLPLDR